MSDILWYVRVSTDDQKQGLEMYTKQAQDFCDRYGHTLIDVFSDEDVSGGIELFKRPAGKLLLKALQEKKGNAIASPNVSRLFRDLRDGVNTIYDLQDDKVKMFLGDGYGMPVDINTPMGFSMVIDQLKYAHFERMQVSDRTTRALAFRRNKQMPTSHAQYGYDKFKDELKFNEREIRVVNEIIALHNKGIGYTQIANKLTEFSIPTKKGGKWSASTVKKIINYQKKVRKELFCNQEQ